MSKRNRPATIGQKNLWSMHFLGLHTDRPDVQRIEQVPCCPIVKTADDVMGNSSTPGGIRTPNPRFRRPLEPPSANADI